MFNELSTIKRGSTRKRAYHLLGKYDLSEDKLKDSIGIGTQNLDLTKRVSAVGADELRKTFARLAVGNIPM